MLIAIECHTAAITRPTSLASAPSTISTLRRKGEQAIRIIAR